MLAFPNAKINIGLHILRKRQDGYHDIETCLYPVPWHDILEVVPADRFSFKQTGLAIPGNKQDNICIKAYETLRKKLNIPPAAIHLHKVIPMGAGLGGGSSDGAFTIKLLNAVFNLNLSLDEMKEEAGKLGSDCPFFIENIPAIATGRGTILEPTSVDLSDLFIGIIKPDIHVSSAEAYSGVAPENRDFLLQDLLESPVASWKNSLFNDFERSVFPKHPSIEKTKELIEKKGSLYSSMSGSGSSVFGLFEKKLQDTEEFTFFKKLKINN